MMNIKNMNLLKNNINIVSNTIVQGVATVGGLADTVAQTASNMVADPTDKIHIEHQSFAFHHVAGTTPTTPKFSTLYQLGEKLHDHAFPYTYQCLHKASGDVRSVKIIPKSSKAIKSPTTFLTDMARLKVLDHPNVAHLVESFEDSEHYYIITDNVQHPNLYQAAIQVAAPHKWLSEAHVAQVITTLLEVLVYVHDKTTKHNANANKNKKPVLAHGHIHPTNILVPDGVSLDQLMLVDFMGELLVPVPTNTKPKRSVSTASSTMSTDTDTDNDDCPASTPQKQSRPKTNSFSPPELYQQGIPTPAGDIWTLGILAFHLLTGKFPFAKPSDRKAGVKDWKGIVNSEAREFIRDLLAYKPSHRPTAFDALDYDWLQAAKDLTTTTKVNGLERKKQCQVMERISSAQSNTNTATTTTTLLGQSNSNTNTNNHNNTNANCHQHKLQQAVSAYIATHLLKKTERTTLDALFRQADRDMNGSLSKQELRLALEQCHIRMPPEELDALFHKMDIDGSQGVDYSEFLAVATQTDVLTLKRKLRAAFDAFDRSHTGFITTRDIQDIFSTSSQVVSERTAKAMIKKADQDGDGKLSFDEFADMMLLDH